MIIIALIAVLFMEVWLEESKQPVPPIIFPIHVYLVSPHVYEQHGLCSKTSNCQPTYHLV